MQRKQSLSDILRSDDRDRLSRAWDSTQAAVDFAPLPKGEYVCRIIGGEPFTSKTNHTAGYKLTFKVLDGEFAGRQVWLDLWLTEAALPMTKRDLAKLGVRSLEQLDGPLPRGIRCRVKLALWREDDGTERNRVRSFEVVGIDTPEADPFAPATAPSPNGQPPANKPPTATATMPGDAAEPNGEVDASFDPESL